MGANDKHEATYHGGEYTPDTKRVRHAYVDHVDYSAQLHGLPSNYKGAGGAFDRWLETVRAEAKAEAYKDAADALHAEARWQTDLLLRHGEYRFRHCANRMTEMENCMLARANQYKEEQ